MTIGRFAPSPTGALHAGSLVAALASWLDARAQGGRWLVRIEDVDTPRCSPAHTAQILQQLHDHGMRPDEAPLLQSQRHPQYEQALQQLTDAGLAYFFVEPLKQANAGFMAQKTAQLGMSSVAKIAKPIVRKLVGGLDDLQIRAVAAYVRRILH